MQTSNVRRPLDPEVVGLKTGHFENNIKRNAYFHLITYPSRLSFMSHCNIALSFFSLFSLFPLLSLSTASHAQSPFHSGDGLSPRIVSALPISLVETVAPL